MKGRSFMRFLQVAYGLGAFLFHPVTAGFVFIIAYAIAIVSLGVYHLVSRER